MKYLKGLLAMFALSALVACGSLGNTVKEPYSITQTNEQRFYVAWAQYNVLLEDVVEYAEKDNANPAVVTTLTELNRTVVKTVDTAARIISCDGQTFAGEPELNLLGTLYCEDIDTSPQALDRSVDTLVAALTVYAEQLIDAQAAAAATEGGN